MSKTRVSRAGVKAGQQLRDEREMAELTQEEFAHALGNTQGYVSLVEAGSDNLATITRFAKALGCSVEVLIKKAGSG